MFYQTTEFRNEVDVKMFRKKHAYAFCPLCSRRLLPQGFQFYLLFKRSFLEKFNICPISRLLQMCFILESVNAYRIMDLTKKRTKLKGTQMTICSF